MAIGLLNNPLLGLGIGLLQGAAPGGTFASGANLGLRNMMAMNQQASVNQLRALQAEKMQADMDRAGKQAEAVERITSQLRTPTPYGMGEAELFPGEAPIAGLETAPTEQALTQANLIEAAPDEYFKQLIENQFGPATTLKQSDIAGLRKEYLQSPETRRFVSSAESFEKIQAAEDTMQGDISLIFNYFKTLDPQSTVREGEFATAEQSAGLPARAVNLYNSVVTGKGRLTDSQRANFKRQAAKLFASQIPGQIRREQIYTGLAQRQSLDPLRIAPSEILDPYRSFNPEAMFPAAAPVTVAEAAQPLIEAAGDVANTVVEGAQNLFGGEGETRITTEEAREVEESGPIATGFRRRMPDGRIIIYSGQGDLEDPQNWNYE